MYNKRDTTYDQQYFQDQQFYTRPRQSDFSQTTTSTLSDIYQDYPYSTSPSSTFSSSPTTYSTSPASPPPFPWHQTTSQAPYPYPQPSSSASSQLQPPEYICLFPHCRHVSARKADLERHVRFTHNRDSVALVDCAFAGGCQRVGAYGFTRKDKMVEHMREVHRCDIPKRGGAGNGRKGSQ